MCDKRKKINGRSKRQDFMVVVFGWLPHHYFWEGFDSRHAVNVFVLKLAETTAEEAAYMSFSWDKGFGYYLFFCGGGGERGFDFLHFKKWVTI